MTGIDWGIVLGVTGIVVSIYFGMKALKASRKQKQSVKSGIGIQSGRDTRIDGI